MSALLTHSHYDSARAVHQTIVKAGDPWFHRITKGQTFRITDLEGNQAVDTLFYNARYGLRIVSGDIKNFFKLLLLKIVKA